MSRNTKYLTVRIETPFDYTGKHFREGDIWFKISLWSQILISGPAVVHKGELCRQEIRQSGRTDYYTLRDELADQFHFGSLFFICGNGLDPAAPETIEKARNLIETHLSKEIAMGAWVSGMYQDRKAKGLIVPPSELVKLQEKNPQKGRKFGEFEAL